MIAMYITVMLLCTYLDKVIALGSSIMRAVTQYLCTAAFILTCN